MVRQLVPVCVAVLLGVGCGAARPVDDKKTDGETPVAEGTEFKLSKDEITVSKEADGDGRFPVTVKAAAAPTAVKMPARKWMLGFYPEAKKADGVMVAAALDDGALFGMRTEAGSPDTKGQWQADEGDVITHVNGYAVKTVQDVVCAVNAAKDPADLQIVIKDVDNKKSYVFYVTAVKR